MLRTHGSLRLLGPGDLPAVTALLGRDPVVNVVADYRARTTQLQPRWLNGEMWGWYEHGDLRSLCHSAANLIPALAGPPALEQFAARAAEQGRRCSTILGPSAQVDRLWDLLAPHWSRPRLVRHGQLHLEIDRPSAAAAEARVRRTGPDDVEVLYPACVAMYTEELGVSPEEQGGAALYRARVSQLVARGWSFAWIEGREVVFKAEIAAASPHACQVQGVYVTPSRRGEGIGVTGMAAVVDLALRHVAPVVSLYVNEHNVAARRAYERVGFRQTDTFTTVMF